MTEPKQFLFNFHFVLNLVFIFLVSLFSCTPANMMYPSVVGLRKGEMSSEFGESGIFIPLSTVEAKLLNILRSWITFLMQIDVQTFLKGQTTSKGLTAYVCCYFPYFLHNLNTFAWKIQNTSRKRSKPTNHSSFKLDLMWSVPFTCLSQRNTIGGSICLYKEPDMQRKCINSKNSEILKHCHQLGGKLSTKPQCKSNAAIWNNLFTWWL